MLLCTRHARIVVFVIVPDLVDGQVTDSVRLDVFECGPVPVRTGAQRQVDFVDHDGFHVFDAQLRDSCGAKRNATCYITYRMYRLG